MKKILVLLLLGTASVFSQEVIDKIVAVVGNEIIMKSELDQETMYFAAQRNLNPDSPELRKQILDAKIEEKLLYNQAEIDSIEVTDEEVNRQIEQQLAYFIRQYGSKERIEEAYGMSIEKIKREMRDDTRKNLMAQMVRQQKFGLIDITRNEVKEFFVENKDSMGVIPEKFEIAHIFINPGKSDKVIERAKELAQNLLDSIKAGADFAELAKEYSDDPGSAAKGGNLGFVKRGVFFPEFESAAFELDKDELSGVVESPVGFHIIQLLERRGESINTRHILIKPKNDDDGEVEVISTLSAIRDSIVRGLNTFEYFAEKYSDDKESKNKGGLLGTFEKSQLEKPLLDQIYKLEEGEIGYPKRLDVDRNTYGYHIVKLVKRVPEHAPSIENDYEDLKKLVEFQKRKNLYDEWITDLKSKIYWEIRL